MLPDVIDEFMIKTGERKESIFYSFFVFFTKLSAGVAIAISTLILEYIYHQIFMHLKNIYIIFYLKICWIH